MIEIEGLRACFQYLLNEISKPEFILLSWKDGSFWEELDNGKQQQACLWTSIGSAPESVLADNNNPYAKSVIGKWDRVDYISIKIIGKKLGDIREKKELIQSVKQILEKLDELPL